MRMELGTSQKLHTIEYNSKWGTAVGPLRMELSSMRCSLLASIGLCRILNRICSRILLIGILGFLILLNHFSLEDAAANCGTNPTSCNWFDLELKSGTRVNVITDAIVNGTESFEPVTIRYHVRGNASNANYELKYTVSERTNDENWTNSSEISSKSMKGNFPAPYDDAIRMDIGTNKHGQWYAQKPNTHSNSQQFTFEPDNNVIKNISKGNSRHVKILVKLFAVGVFLGSEEYTITYVNFDSINLSWEANNSPKIIPDGNSNYAEIDGLITITPATAFPLKYGGYEIKLDGTKTPASVGNTREITNKFPGWDVPVGANLKYGLWVVSRNSDKFLFRPNSFEINKLSDSQTVFSTLEVTPLDNDGNPIGDKQTISVTIGKNQIGVYWGDGTELDDIENSKIAIAEAPDIFSDISGLMVANFDKLSDGPQNTKKNKWRFTWFDDSTPESTNDVPEVGAADSDNPSWNTTNVSNGVEETTDIVGMETKVGNNASNGTYGTWYISETDSYTGPNYLAHTSSRQFIFKPNLERLKGLARGVVVRSYLRIQSGACNVTASSDCSLGGSTVGVPSATVIAVEIIRGEPVRVRISDVTKDEGNGSGGTEFLFKVSIDSGNALPRAFTVPVVFSHGTTSDEDFMPSQNLSNLNVTFAPGDKEKSIPIMVKGDIVGESDETFALKLSEPTGAAKDENLVQLDTELGGGVGIGTIVDDDRAQVSINDVSQAEGTGETSGTGFQFTVSLSPATALNQTFTVPITFAHVSTDSSDFVNDPTLANFDLSFRTTDTSVDVRVILVNHDRDGEENERFTLTLSEPTGDAKTMNLVTLSSAPGATVGTGTINDDDAKDITLSWLAGFDGTIIGDGQSDHYGYKVALITDDTTTHDRYAATEMKNEDVINRRAILGHLPTVSLNLSLYPEFTGSGQAIFGIDSGFLYGHWYVRNNNTGSCGKRYCEHVLFVPNARAINQLNPGDIVKSTFVYSLYSGHSSAPTILETSSLTVTITADYGTSLIGFDYDSRSIEIAESEPADLTVFISEAMNRPTTISYRIVEGTAELDSDFRSPTTTLTIPAGRDRSTISIPIIDDSTNEENEEFVVLLSDGADFEITPALQSAKVKILDDDSPDIVVPGMKACHDVTKPASVATPYIEAYWENGAPTVDREPAVYRRAGDAFDVRIGFRDPTDETPKAHPGNNTFYFAIYYDNGDPENPGIDKLARNGWGGVGQRISQPGSFRGYLRYRILPRLVNNNTWYSVGAPCEFYIWWTDANRPGITMSIDETVQEGLSFRVTATATPAPNRDILVPVTLSQDPRIAGERNFNIRIRAGQASGYADVPTKFVPNNQPAGEVTASTEWRNHYWLDDTKKSATVTIVDHDKKIVTFKNPEPDIVVGEAGNAELIVNIEGTNSSGVTVKYRIDDVDTDASDYMAPANTQIRVATGNEGTISIPINPDQDFESSESFTVTLIESDDALPGSSNSSATVTIISDDAPSIVPSTTACNNPTQPQQVTTPNTHAYFKNLPDIIYKSVSTGALSVEVGFQNPTTVSHGTTFYFAANDIGGRDIPNLSQNRFAGDNSDSIKFYINAPLEPRGYVRYSIIPRGLGNNPEQWYDIEAPCDFDVWWTGASTPGITLSVDKNVVVEGSSFKVTATATPKPNRDILIPITFSDSSRIVDSQSYEIRITSGQSSGHTDILTRFVPGDQSGNNLTVSAEWRSSYWMDETVRSQNITVTESRKPTLSIRSNGSVTEADQFAANFTVTSDSNPGNAVEVHYTPTETGNFLVAPVPNLAARTNNGHISGQITSSTLTFIDKSEAGDGSGPFESPLTIPLRGDAILASRVHSVSVRLNSDVNGTDYDVSTSSFSASVNIIEDESLPVLTLEGSNNPVDFDEPTTPGFLMFKVTASAMPQDTYPDTAGMVETDVRYSLAQTGNFINITSGSISLAEPNTAKLTFAESNGTVTADLAIPIIADNIGEPSGSVSVTLLAADTPMYYYVLSSDEGKSSHTVKVYDNDDPELSISISEARFLEGSDSQIQFTVTSRFTVNTPLTVNFKAEEFESSDSATPSGQKEFLGTNSSPVALNFSSSRTQHLNIAITDDSVAESMNRYVKVTLLAGANYSVAGADEGGSATILVVDDDSKPLIWISAPTSAIESGGEVQFTVSALVDPGVIVVNFALTDDDTEDYLTDVETARVVDVLIMNDNDSDGTYTDEITVNLDNDPHSDRTGEITLELLDSINFYTLGAATTATVIIYDDDAPELTISSGGSVTEGDPGDSVTASFIVESQVLPNMGEPDQGRLRVHYTPTSDNFLDPAVSGTSSVANLSFSDASGSGDGPYRAELEVPVQNDRVEEVDGTIRVTLEDESTPGTSYYVVDTSTSQHFATVEVIDNDKVASSLVNFSADSLAKTVQESAGSVELEITLTSALTADLVVVYSLGHGGTATLNIDFLIPTTITTIAKGKTSQKITLTILADSEENEGSEYFDITLTQAFGSAQLGSNTTARVTISEANPVNFSADSLDKTVLESAGIVQLEVTMSNALAADVTVDFSLEPGGTATLNTDFLIPNYAATITKGQTSQKITLVIVPDSEANEGLEYFEITLTRVSGNAQLGSNTTARVTIAEANLVNFADDSLDKTVLESDGSVELAINMLIATATDTTVAYILKPGGTATSGSDFQIPSNSATIAQGETSQKITLPILADSVANEGLEYFEITLTTVSGSAQLGSKTTAKVTISETNLVNFAADSLNKTVLESEESVDLTVKLLKAAVADVEVFYTLKSGGTATSGSDFVVPAFTTTIAQGKTSQKITLTILSDGESETEEYFEISLVLVVSGEVKLGTKTTARVLIVDPDPVSITAASGAVRAGDVVEFTVSIYPPPQRNLPVPLTISQTSDLVLLHAPKYANFRATEVSSTFSIRTNPDKTTGGSIIVRVGPYNGVTDEARVSVSPRSNSNVAETKYSVASSVIEMILRQIPHTAPQDSSNVAKPTLTISAVKMSVEEGQPAVFTISTSFAVNSAFPVSIELSQSGDFVLGPMRRSVEFDAERLETEFSVDTDDDRLAESDGEITATIQDGRGYIVGAENTTHVIVSDALDRQSRKNGVSNALNAMLPDLLANSTARTVGIASERVRQTFSGSPTTSIELNGLSPAMTILKSGGEMLNDSSADWRTIIDDSSFTVALYPEGGETSLATVWGVGDRSSLSGDGIGGQQSWDGETHSGHFGFDSRIGHGVLAGLAMSVSQSEVDVEQWKDSEMSFGTLTTGIHPYLGLFTSDGNSQLQVMAGYGENELELKQAGYSSEFLSGGFHAVGFDGSSIFFSNERFGELHNLELGVAGEAWHAQQFVNSAEGVVDDLEVSASHVRIAIETSHEQDLGAGGALSPSISIGLRGDGRNEKSVFGLSVDSAIGYGAFDGLEVLGSGKSLLSGLNRVDRWEVDGSLDYDSGKDDKGLLFNISSTWSGIDASEERYIWGRELVDASNYSLFSSGGNSISTEIGYGFDILDGAAVLTPFHALNQSSADRTEFRVGSRFTSNTSVSLELEVVKVISETGAVGNEINLTGNINW